MNNQLERLKEIIETLKLEGRINTQADIAADLGYTRPGTISEIVNGKIPLTNKFLQAFGLYYNVNKDFITKGTGTPFLSEFSPHTRSKLKENFAETAGGLQGPDDHTKAATWPGIPMYDTPVTAGAINIIRDEKVTEPAYYLQIPSFKDCTFGARVSGDSMYPEIRNGDYVVCKEIQTMDSLIYGDIYLIVTTDGMETVKYVHPHDENNEWIKLVPYNKSVPPTPMPKRNIFKIYKVKGVLKGY